MWQDLLMKSNWCQCLDVSRINLCCGLTKKKNKWRTVHEAETVLFVEIRGLGYTHRVFIAFIYFFFGALYLCGTLQASDTASDQWLHFLLSNLIHPKLPSTSQPFFEQLNKQYNKKIIQLLNKTAVKEVQ